MYPGLNWCSLAILWELVCHDLSFYYFKITHAVSNQNCYLTLVATALLCALQYNISEQGTRQRKPSIVSFGGPRVCNDSFAGFVHNTALKGCNILNLIHNKDPVLANNQKLWDSLGFKNVGTELQCEPKKSHLLKETDRNNQSFAWNIIDHCYYLGVFVGPRLIF